MLLRTLTIYFWSAPLMFFPLWGVYHEAGPRAGIAVATLHLALIAAAMYVRHAFAARSFQTARGLAGFLLVAGGAIIWFAGPSGPPTLTHPLLAHFNNSGLTLGFFVILLGLAALIADHPAPGDRALAVVGFTCFLVAFTLWTLQSLVLWARLAAPQFNEPSLRPDWLVFALDFQSRMIALIPGAGFLATVCCALAQAARGRLMRTPGRLMLAFGLFGIPLGAAGILPFNIPAMLAVVPYLLGVNLLCASDRTGDEVSP